MRLTCRRFGIVGSRRTRDWCFTVEPEWASPSTPSPATRRTPSHEGLLKLWVPLRATATTTPLLCPRCIVMPAESARVALAERPGDSGVSWDAQEVPLTELDPTVAK